mmetsp:Transcript_44999/g.105563  ORF Transcript_44999/g.105563 Transcript_44999/m.105563 type:complete len:286 (-) Transcript_44999:354-1211(-)
MVRTVPCVLHPPHLEVMAERLEHADEASVEPGVLVAPQRNRRPLVPPRAPQQLRPGPANRRKEEGGEELGPRELCFGRARGLEDALDEGGVDGALVHVDARERARHVLGLARRVEHGPSKRPRHRRVRQPGHRHAQGVDGAPGAGAVDEAQPRALRRPVRRHVHAHVAPDRVPRQENLVGADDVVQEDLQLALPQIDPVHRLSRFVRPSEADEVDGVDRRSNGVGDLVHVLRKVLRAHPEPMHKNKRMRSTNRRIRKHSLVECFQAIDHQDTIFDFSAKRGGRGG